METVCFSFWASLIMNVSLSFLSFFFFLQRRPCRYKAVDSLLASRGLVRLRSSVQRPESSWRYLDLYKMVAFKLPWAHRPANGSAAENAPLLGAPGKPHATNRNSNLHHENGNGNYVNSLPRSRVRWESPTRHLSYGVQIPQAPGVSRYFVSWRIHPRILVD